MPRRPSMNVIVQVDTREKKPLRIEAYPTERVTLPAGDYGLSGFSDWDNPRFIVERKTLDDLVSSLTHGRERFLREAARLRRFGFAAVLVEGRREDIFEGRYRSKAAPNAVIGSIAMLEVRYNLHFCFAGDAEGAARALERLVRVFVNGVAQDFRHLVKDTATR